MVNWGIALGAGAKSALDTYERLDDTERRENADKRAERALKILEDTSSRASARFAQEQSDRNRAREIAQRFGAGQPAPEISTGQAGARTSGALNASTGEATPPTTETARRRGGAMPAPAASQPQAQPRPQGVGLGGLRDEYMRAGLFDHAKDVTDIMGADARREVSRLQAKVLRGELSDADRKRSQEIYARKTEQLMALGEQLPQNDNDPLTPDMAPLTRKLTEMAGQAKSFLPDGIGMEFEHNEDGSVTVKTIDTETGKLMGERKLTTAGQFRELINRAGALTDSVASAKWQAYMAIQKRDAELKEFELRKTRSEALGAERKERASQLEEDMLATYLRALKTPGENEEILRSTGRQLYLLNDKWGEKFETVDPETGTKTTGTRSKFDRWTDEVVPLREVEVTDDKGQTGKLTSQDALQGYVEGLPQLIQESGGNPNVAMARMQNDYDKVKGFRPGAFARDVRPIIEPQVMAFVRQLHESQMQAQRGVGLAQPGQGQQQTQAPPSFSSEPGYWERVQARRRADAEAKAQRGQTRFGDRLSGRKMPWEHGLRGQ